MCHIFKVTLKIFLKTSNYFLSLKAKKTKNKNGEDVNMNKLQVKKYYILTEDNN